MVSHCTTAFGPVRSHPHRARQSPEADFRLDTSGHQGQAGYKPGPVKVPPSNRGTGLTLSSVSVAPLWYPTPRLRSLCNPSAAPPVSWKACATASVPSEGVEASPNAASANKCEHRNRNYFLFADMFICVVCFEETLNTNRTKSLFLFAMDLSNF